MVVFPVVELWTRVATLLGVATQSAFNPGRSEYRNHVVWDATPLGLRLYDDGSLLRWFSQGSRVRLPWAVGCNPVGVATESTSAAPLPAPLPSAPFAPLLLCSSAPLLCA